MVKIGRNGDILPILVLILLSIIRSSDQTVYSCDPNQPCGCSTNSATVSRIVGGENASASTWNWAVSINIASVLGCGGSIISSSWVVTAAHCTDGYDASDLTIYAGSTIVYSGTQIRVASELIMHPDYNAATFENDIALLRLDPPLSMSDPNVSTICLPAICDAVLSIGEWPASEQNVVAVGWGRLSEGGSTTPYLQQVTVQTVDYRAFTCTAAMHNWHVQLCAGVEGGGKDTCKGDSGGPLMLFTETKQWMLVGVTSTGFGCARPTNSGVYTRVAAFRSWINLVTLDTDSSTSAVTTSSVQTTTFPGINSYANIVLTSFFSVFVLPYLLIAFLY